MIVIWANVQNLVDASITYPENVNTLGRWTKWLSVKAKASVNNKEVQF